MENENPKDNFPLIEAQKLLNLGFFDWNLETNEIIFSEVMTKILGLPSQVKYQFKDLIKVVLEAERDKFKNEIKEFLKNNKPFVIEFRYLIKDVVHQVSWSGTPIINSNGKVDRILGFGQEINVADNFFSLIKLGANSLKRTQRIANIGNWAWDNINHTIECDDGMYTIFEIAPNLFNLDLRNIRSFFSPMEWKKCLIFIRKHMRQKKDGWFEQKIFSGEGKQKEVAIFFEFEYDEKGIIKIVHGIVQDISKQKLDKEQFRHYVEFERMVSAISSNFINLKSVRIDAGIKLALDIIGNFMNVNRAYLINFSDDNKTAKLNYQWHSEYIDHFADDQSTFLISQFPLLFGGICNGNTIYIEDVNHIEQLYTFEKEFLLSKGAHSIIWVPLSLEGKVIGVLGFDSVQTAKTWTDDEISLLRICGEVFVNALSRKNYEIDLKKNEEHLSIVVDSIGDVVIAIDNVNKIVRVNIAAETLTGFQHDEIVGKNIEDLIQFNGKSEAYKNVGIVQRILEMNNDGRANELLNLITKDKKEIPVLVHGSPLKGANIGVIGTVLVCREMTNQIKLEEQLRHSEKMRAIGQLSGGIAHDFNNLLTGIIGCANYLKKHIGPNPNLLEYVENILITGRRAATLTSQLLAFSRHEKPRLSEIDLNILVSEVINLLKHTIDPRIRMHKDFKISHALIEGDESQLHNAVLNLAVNARDAMPSGGNLYFATDILEFTKETCVNEFSTLKPGKYIALSIKDTGCGIPPELITHIFEPFFTTKEKGKGTGLGLAAVYGTVHSHHGCITVQSKVGSHTIFTLYLPKANRKTDSIENTENLNVKANPNKKRVLVVDDEILLCTLACESLNDAGYITIAAYNGLEALNIYKTEHQNIDIVLVDMLMPNMNGPQLLEKMFEINPALKAIIVSGFTGNLEFKDIIKNKKLPFLQKPYEEKNLLKIIEQQLAR